jgi:hypothetical protein
LRWIGPQSLTPGQISKMDLLLKTAFIIFSKLNELREKKIDMDEFEKELYETSSRLLTSEMKRYEVLAEKALSESNGFEHT